ncbi:MAG TPA: hypothetical protein VGM20_04370 [Gemmatimonadales bacterium]|jgi:hypothetical protein
MLPGDLAFVFHDLDCAGLVATVEIGRRTVTGQSTRGVATETWTPVAGCSDVRCFFNNSAETLVAAGYGGSEEYDLVGSFPPGTDIDERDRITVTNGSREGQQFKVVNVHGEKDGISSLLATLQRITTP